MTCLDCKHALFLRNLKGDIDLTCTKYNEVVYVRDKCHHTKEYKREKKIIDYYLKHYKQKSIQEIAKKFKLDRKFLDYFVHSHYLPRRRDEKEKK